MQEKAFTMMTPDGITIHGIRWTPDFVDAEAKEHTGTLVASETEAVLGTAIADATEHQTAHEAVHRGEQVSAPFRAVVQIAHGMGETGARYAGFAKALTERGYAVYVHDHRGHGLTAESKDKLGYIGSAGFRGLVEDVHRVRQQIDHDAPDTPVFLLGHSLGSFIAQRYASLHGAWLTGLVVSGTMGPRGIDIYVGAWLAKWMKQITKDAPSRFLAGLTFMGFNRPFKPNRTPMDWLTRDDAEIDQLLSNPYFILYFPPSFYEQLYLGIIQTYKSSSLQDIPHQLPILFISGEDDPLGGRHLRGVKKLMALYRNLGIQRLTQRFYPGGRHEMLNEINRGEVTADLLQWMDTVLEEGALEEEPLGRPVP